VIIDHPAAVVSSAEALFASPVPTGSHLTLVLLHAAVAAALRRHGGIRACVGMMAAAYGDSPEAAAARMRWALAAVEDARATRRTA
jgi:hypothetical protein